MQIQKRDTCPAETGSPTFNIATSERWTNKLGEKKEWTEWHRIAAFGKLAETCANFLFKGKQIYVEGRIQTRQWDDREDNKRYTTEIVASKMLMLGRKDSRDSGNYSYGLEETWPREPKLKEDDDGDIPF